MHFSVFGVCVCVRARVSANMRVYFYMRARVRA